MIGHRLIVSGASSDGDSTGLVDDTLLGGDDNYNGWWFVATSRGANAGAIRRVSDYDAATTRLNWKRPLPQGTAANDSYEMWPSEYSPPAIHDYINQAVREAAGHIYEPVEDVSLHAGGGMARFAIPEGVDAISKVRARVSSASLPVHRFGATFGERTAAGWEQSLDTGGLRGGARRCESGFRRGRGTASSSRTR